MRLTTNGMSERTNERITKQKKTGQGICVRCACISKSDKQKNQYPEDSIR